MKTLIFCLFAAALLCSCSSQSVMGQVPSVPYNAFQQQFPNARDVEWESKGLIWKVEFEIGWKDHKAWIDSAGKIVRHKQDASASDLPEAVRQTIQNNYAGYRIDDVDKIEENGAVFYEVELEGSAGDFEAIFDATGKVVQNQWD